MDGWMNDMCLQIVPTPAPGANLSTSHTMNGGRTVGS